MELPHWGRVMGPVGLVLLLASTLTIFVAGDTWLGSINIVLGLVCVAFYLVTNFGRLAGQMAGRGGFYLATSAVTAALLMVGLLAANFMAIKHPKTWDVTKDKIHTFSSDTQKTVAGLKDKVDVVAFFKTGDPEVAVWEDILERYKALNTDKFTFRVVDPEKEPQLVSEVGVHAGGPRVVVRYGNLNAKVSAPTEEELTNALVKVTHSKEKKVYFFDGHGEAPLDSRDAEGFSQLVQRMKDEGLEAEKLTFGHGQIPDDAAAVVVAGPQKPLLPAEVGILEKYLDEGGHVFVMVDPLVQTGLDPLLAKYGIGVEPGVIVDQVGRDQFDSPMNAVGVPGSEHPIVQGFRLVTMYPQAASLTLTTATGVAASPLIESLGSNDGQPITWLEGAAGAPGSPSGAKRFGPFHLAIVATKAIKKDASGHRSDEARLVVFGDHDFANNGHLSVQGNGDLALNTMNWLADQAERISIRPRTREASRLFLTSAQMGGIRFFATELPIGLLALGLAIFFNRRAK